VLVPVKSFAQAKGRLAAVLSPAQRAGLARAMAAIVVQAARPLPVYVVCDDPLVRRWAEHHHAGVLWRPGRGLNQAVADGVEALAGLGYRRVVVAHSDLPLAVDLSVVLGDAGLTLVPDRRQDGTNVLSLPAGCGFRFRYGAGSFSAHRAEADRLGLPLRVLEHPELGFDVDVPADLRDAVAGSAALRRLLESADA
jgi:2-phospho-L-lactate guanylyltransferase